MQGIIYSLFGTNFVIGSHVKEQIKVLEDNLPQVFRRRDLDDLGCGDGKITLRLKKIFQPRSLRGFDVNPNLVKRARKFGIEAEVTDLDSDMPTGELAVMWGVLHHLKDREACIKRIKENYRMAFIREPVKSDLRVDWEMGQPLVREEIENLVNQYLPDARVFYYVNSIFIFYVSPELNLSTGNLSPSKS
jgi:hypothetical protein